MITAAMVRCWDCGESDWEEHRDFPAYYKCRRCGTVMSTSEMKRAVAKVSLAAKKKGRTL